MIKKRRMNALKNKVKFATYVKSLFKKETPWYIKTLAGISLAYTILPLDVLPDFLGLIGIVDDAAVMGILTTAGLGLLNTYYERHPELIQAQK